MEGTPGYQAPEIRPRIVYDEKVNVAYLLGQPLGDRLSHRGLSRSPLHSPKEVCPFLSVAASRLTCSRMGWFCTSYCLVSGLC